jgi:hypothetical protein
MKLPIIVSSLLIAGSASAQLPGLGLISSSGARIGFFFPSNDQGKALGKQWTVIGFDTRLGPKIGPVELEASVDYYERNGGRNVATLLNGRFRIGKSLSLSAGTGVGFERVPGVTSRTSSNSQISARYEFSTTGVGGLFFEARYYASRAKQLQGVGFLFGIRF